MVRAAALFCLLLAPSAWAGPETITPKQLLGAIEVLASDRFEGRAPGSHGEALTLEYMIDQFKAAGLAPGNPDGTYLQAVPLMGFKTDVSADFRSEKTFAPSIPGQLVASTQRAQALVRISSSPVVFVGYGVSAPEYRWDDYKSLDMAGKTVVMLVNDPGFKGEDMTYYGRWTYKYEVAAVKKAAAVLIVHDADRAGYPWEVVQHSVNGHESMSLERIDPNSQRAPVDAWISSDTAKLLFAMAGQDFDALKKAASSRDFTPVELKIQADFALSNQLRPVKSYNVAAKIEGSDPKLKDELIIYSAHWDHFGRDPRRKGDQVYHGAVDNASGVSALLSLAKAFASSRTRPKRSILFLATTAEEQGLLGAKYYAENPLYPLSKTVADINMDMMNVWGPTRDFRIHGSGYSTLDEDAQAVASESGRILSASSNKDGSYFRADHFEFAKHGVPSLDYGIGRTFLGKDPASMRRRYEQYSDHDYHNTTDTVRPNWDLSGLAEDVRVLYALGLRLADSDRWPRWKDPQFKDARP